MRNLPKGLKKKTDLGKEHRRLKEMVVMMEEPREMAESAKGLEKENGPWKRTQAVAHVIEKTE